ncbi:MAG: hypothetical protein ACLU71_14505 [Blautia hansenii]
MWKYCLKALQGIHNHELYAAVFLAGVALADRTPVRMIFFWMQW